MKRAKIIGLILFGAVDLSDPPCRSQSPARRVVHGHAAHRRRRLAAIRKGSRLAEGAGQMENGIRFRRRRRWRRPHVDTEPPRTLVPAQSRSDNQPAPPVMEFDNAGNFIQGWGGRKRSRIPMALERARHHRGLQRVRLDHGKRGWQAQQSRPSPERQPDSQIHEGRQIRDGHR